MLILSILLLDISFNAFLVSINLGSLLLNLSMLFIRGDSVYIFSSLLLLVCTVLIWFLDIVIESLLGYLSVLTQSNLITGFILFIVSEVVIFMTLFGCYYYNVFIRSIFIGGVWVRIGVLNYTYNGIGLLNVLILFYSGALVTSSLDYKRSRVWCILYLSLSIILGIVFVGIQYIEFSSGKFTISDSIYGTIFYSLTGLLGILMIIGITILLVSLVRIVSYNPSNINLIAGSINLLLLDILFIFIYIFIYCYY